MADRAESSTAGQKRRRRALTGRVIAYSEDLVLPSADDPLIPIEDRDLREHTLLRFAETSPEFRVLERLIDTELLQHRTFDWELLQTLGCAGRMTDLLGDRWAAALRCDAAQFSELTLEFHSTLQYVPSTLTDPSAISFSLGRQTHTMSISDFAIHSGLYTAEEVTLPIFTESIRGIVREESPLGVTAIQLGTFWAEIADGPSSSTPPASSIRDPFYRYLHRILACTLIGRKSGADKCSQLDQLCLYSIIGRHPANLALILLSSFTRVRRGGDDARIALGPYITRIARRLDVFQQFPSITLTRGPPTAQFDRDLMRLARLLEQDDPVRWVPVKAPAAAGVHRQAPAPIIPQVRQPRAPRPPRITLDLIWDRLDRMEEASQRAEEARQRSDAARQRSDRALRLLLEHQGCQVPDWFAEPTEDAAAADGAEEERADE